MDIFYDLTLYDRLYRNNDEKSILRESKIVSFPKHSCMFAFHFMHYSCDTNRMNNYYLSLRQSCGMWLPQVSFDSTINIQSLLILITFIKFLAKNLSICLVDSIATRIHFHFHHSFLVEILWFYSIVQFILFEITSIMLFNMQYYVYVRNILIYIYHKLHGWQSSAIQLNRRRENIGCNCVSVTVSGYCSVSIK